MSKEKISTKEKIVAKALEMFNEFGIEYVGVRELAKALDMKGGNITYYFPTKDDIVLELGNMLAEANNKVIIKKEGLTLSGFLEIFRQAYENHYTFRSLFMSIPHLLKQNKALAQRYQHRQVLRRDTILSQLKDLSQTGYLRQLSEEELDTILRTIVITSRFWISNASVEGKAGLKTSSEYVELIAGLLMLVATPKGKKDIGQFLASN